MGIDIGDAIADGTDLHGDGVIVAARLQAKCPPGSVCVSRAVRDHVHDQLDLTFEPLGPLSLKNISRPVDAFLVRPTAMPRSVEQALVHGTSALPLPDKPSIAVLAFTNMSGDLGHEYFSDGIADDIITELSRSRSLFVISRNSSFSYRGRSVDVRQIARELGVRYVLEGSVRRSAGRVRVTAQLIDAETGNHIWAERYDRDVSEVFAVQDEITAAVANAILPAVANVERQRALRKPPESLGAWETYQRGLWHLSKGTSTDNAQARLLFRNATESDPGFAPAFTGLALTYHRDGLFYGIISHTESGRLAEIEARMAVAIDPDDAEAHAALGVAVGAFGDVKQALECGERAVALNRNSASAHYIRGARLAFSGQFAKGRADLLMSLRLNPRDPTSALAASVLAGSWYFEGNYKAAAEMAARCLANYPAHPGPRRFLAAALGQLGRRAEAAAALRDFMDNAPQVFDSLVRQRAPFVRPEDHEHMLEGLRKAGWRG